MRFEPRKDHNISYKYLLIRDKTDNHICPFCNKCITTRMEYGKAVLRKCVKCKIIFTTLSNYYLFGTQFQEQFSNTDEIQQIAKDNPYDYNCIRNRIASRRRTGYLTSGGERIMSKEKEEKMREREQIRVDKDYGDGPLGFAPKKRKRSFFS